MPVAVRDEIERRARLPVPPTAKQIQVALEQDPRFADAVPSLSRIQQIARAAAVVDDSERWPLGGAGSSAALVLPVLAHVIEETHGKRRHVTRREAVWIVRVRRARPDLLPWWVYQFVRAYVAAESRSDSAGLARLDEQLALAPLQSPIDPTALRALSSIRYDRGLREGWIPSAMFMIRPEDPESLEEGTK